MATKKQDLLEKESISMKCELNIEEELQKFPWKLLMKQETPLLLTVQKTNRSWMALKIMDESAEASALSDPSESDPPELSETDPVIEPEAGNSPFRHAAETVSVKPKRARKKAEQTIQTPDSKQNPITP